MDTTTRRPGSTILVVAGIVLIATIVVAAVLAARDVTTYPADTPEAAAQAYLQALFDEDEDEAWTHLAPELQDRCGDPDNLKPWWLSRSDTARFAAVEIVADRAEIDVELTAREFDPGLFPFDNYRYERDTELVLELRNGTWLITEAAWPVFACPGR